MESLVRITKTDNETTICFNSCFPTEITVNIDEHDIISLGNLLLRLGNKKRGFKWSAVASAPWGRFVFKVTGDKKPSLRFEYQIHNEHLKTVSDCESFYDTASFEGILQFGEEMLELNNKTAVLCEYNNKTAGV